MEGDGAPDMNVFMERFRELKSSLSLPGASCYISNYSVDDDDANQPLSFSIIFDTIDNIADKIDKRDPSESSIYKFVESITSLMPGFPGGGRSFIEIPINVSMYEIGEVMAEIRGVLIKFKELFRYGQSSRSYSQWVDHETRTIENMEFMACMPENGGAPSIDISIKYVSNIVILIISVDSYWQPAIDLFKKAYNIAFSYCFNLDSKVITTQKVSALVEEHRKKCYNDARDTILNKKRGKSVYAQASQSPSSSSGGASDCMMFSSPDFTYAEYMSFLHRNAILTTLLKMIAQVKTKMGRKIVDKSYQEAMLSAVLQMPSLSDTMAAILREDMAFIKGGPVFLRLIDPMHIRNAVHSTIRFIEEDTGITVYFSKKEYGRSDVFTGNAIMTYGDNDGVYVINSIKTQKDINVSADISSVRFVSRNKEKIGTLADQGISFFDSFGSDMFYLSRALNELIFQTDLMWLSIYKSRWMCYQGKQNERETYSITFDSSDKKLVLERDFKEVIPFQPYCDDIGINVSHRPIEEQYLVETAVHEFIKRFNDGFDMTIYEKSQITIMPTVLTLQCVRSIDKMSVDELVMTQIKRNETSEDRPNHVVVPGNVSNLHMASFLEDHPELGIVRFSTNFVPHDYFDGYGDADSSIAYEQRKKYYIIEYIRH